MSNQTIRPACSSWPLINERLRGLVATLTEKQLSIRPSPDRWPLWATVSLDSPRAV